MRLILLWIVMSLLSLPARAIEVVIMTGPAGSVADREIGPAIKEVIKPVADKYGHSVKLEPSPNTATTLRRCGSIQDRFCIGIALPGIPVDLPEHKRPDILRTKLDLACAVAVTRQNRFPDFPSALKRGVDTPFVVDGNSDAHGLLKTMVALHPTLEGQTPRIIERPWPEARLSIAARVGGVALDYGFPDPDRGISRHADDESWQFLEVLSPRPAERLSAFHLEPRVTANADHEPIATICAPAMLVATPPKRVFPPVLDEREAAFVRADLREMIEEIEWSVATQFARADRDAVFPAPSEGPGWGQEVCAKLNSLLETGDTLTTGSGAIGDALRRFGIRAVAHSSGKWIVTAGGAYVAGTIGIPGMIVAVISGPSIITAGTVVTLAGYLGRATCQVGVPD